jgi:membrane-associated protein
MSILKSGSYVVLFAIIFAESGLLVGFFLPGDSLLFTAGLLAATTLPGMSGPLFSLPIILIGCFLAAVIGDSVGYTFGRRVGRRLFQKEDSIFFHKKHIVRAQEFYEKHGAKTIVIARFIPIVRTFAPIVAGIGEMHYRTFVIYNIVGGVLWAIGVTLLGYFLGTRIDPHDIDKYLFPIIILIVLISVAPAAWHILKEAENREAIRNGIRSGMTRIANRRNPAAPVNTAADTEVK